MTDIPEDIRAAAQKAIWDNGRGMIGRERNYLEYRVERALLAEREATIERCAKMLEAKVEKLRSLALYPLAPNLMAKVDTLNEIAAAIRSQGKE